MSLMTKKDLATSLKKLMDKKSLKKITVKDVVTDCGVNRQTFYYHFRDISDLLAWIYRTEALAEIAGYKTYETWQQGFIRIFQYVAENRRFCLNTFYSLHRDPLDQFFYRVTYDLLIGVVDELSEGTNILNEHKKFIADFYSYAFNGLLLAWLKGRMKDTPEQIIKDLNKMIEGDMKRAIERFSQ